MPGSFVTVTLQQQRTGNTRRGHHALKPLAHVNELFNRANHSRSSDAAALLTLLAVAAVDVLTNPFDVDLIEVGYEMPPGTPKFSASFATHFQVAKILSKPIAPSESK
jgi:hypothetical protein